MLDFSSVRNAHEKTVFEQVAERADHYPGLSHIPGLLEDVACVALNRLQPRYIRHAADLAFFATAKEHEATVQRIAEAVEYAFGYVQARHAMAARR